MTRRTTVIQPSTTTDALYTLPNQPFKRRIVSACIYGFIQDASSNLQPELRINDVEGNVLFTSSVEINLAAAFPLMSFVWGVNLTESLIAAVLSFYGTLSPGGASLSEPIPPDTIVPESNIFTVTIWGSLPADTLPNLVLVTEDEDDDDLIY